MRIVAMSAEHVDGVVELFRSVPEGELTFVKEDTSDPAAIAGWIGRLGQRWLAVGGDGTVAGFAAVLPLTGWSDHVGDVRLLVGPRRRGAGVGTALARHAVTSAVAHGLTKLVVELPAEDVHSIDMFARLGFTGEALLRDHIRDRAGQLRDLVVLAHLVGESWANLATVGIADEAEPEEPA